MTQVIKIYYPTADEDGIQGETNRIREEVLRYFERNQVSYSFSKRKDSGYIMVYPTLPILSFRISTHRKDGSAPEQELLKYDGRITDINAEMDGGEEIAEAIVINALRNLKKKGTDIKTLLHTHDIV